jgi:hypothetical protein
MVWSGSMRYPKGPSLAKSPFLKLSNKATGPAKMTTLLFTIDFLK